MVAPGTHPGTSIRPSAGPRRGLAACLFAGLLAACGSGAEEATPTTTVDQIQTEAVATFAGGLTSTALAMPTSTPTETATPTLMATVPPLATNTAASTAVPTSPVDTCYGLTFVADVTIPDNTTITPGQQFTKTWRVRNSGSCAWQAGFDFNYVGGEAMGGSSVSLGSAVQPGSEAEISVDLTAPTTAATYRGNWRMTNNSGAYFGDEVFVQIVVGSATAAPTSSATATQASTAMPTATATAPASPTPTETSS